MGKRIHLETTYRPKASKPVSEAKVAPKASNPAKVAKRPSEDAAAILKAIRASRAKAMRKYRAKKAAGK